MLYEKDNDANNADISKFNMKNWVNLNDNKIISINSSELNIDKAYNIIDSKNIEENLKNNENNTFNEVNKIDLHKGSFAHNLHPNIEVFANSLLNKLDTLQNTQLDIHHVEMITDRVFHSVEKLKYEIRDIHDYIQKIESRNKNLEAKLDLLITQNEAINIQNQQLKTICEHFFSKDMNKADLQENKGVKFQESPKTLEDTEYNNTEEISKNKVDIQESNEISNQTNKNNSDIRNLLKSKKQIESFIKNNYPDDYVEMKQYNRANIFNWVNRVLGFN